MRVIVENHVERRHLSKPMAASMPSVNITPAVESITLYYLITLPEIVHAP